jgi:hypothetical protein
MIINTKIIQAIWVGFQDKSRGAGRKISWNPGFAQAGVHDQIFMIYPDDSNCKPHEEHMDRSVDNTILFLNEQEPLIGL